MPLPVNDTDPGADDGTTVADPADTDTAPVNPNESLNVEDPPTTFSAPDPVNPEEPPDQLWVPDNSNVVVSGTFTTADVVPPPHNRNVEPAVRQVDFPVAQRQIDLDVPVAF